VNFTVVAVDATLLPAFFAYLDEHLRDNGAAGTPLFQPLARAGARLPDAKRAAFVHGMGMRLDQPGWRRVWVMRDAGGAIAGHVDLRARPEPAAAHRALLGMGVQRDYRRRGLGMRLLAAALAWARAQDGLAWIDLEVLTANAPARQLYLRAGFAINGEYADMLRIDGASLATTHMSQQL
jgi:RimJ/RimL family protein N-acetyltransferase